MNSKTKNGFWWSLKPSNWMYQTWDQCITINMSRIINSLTNQMDLNVVCYVGRQISPFLACPCILNFGLNCSQLTWWPYWDQTGWTLCIGIFVRLAFQTTISKTENHRTVPFVDHYAQAKVVHLVDFVFF